jgi:hypothetical protein
LLRKRRGCRLAVLKPARPCAVAIVCLQTMRAASPDQRDTQGELQLVCIADVRIRFDHAPGQSVPGVWLCRLYRLFRWSGRVVLCYCESGSGASLGACGSRSVFGLVKGPVVQPTCLTGNCCSQEWRPNGWTARVQRRDERFYRMDLSACCVSNNDETAVRKDRVVCGKHNISRCRPYTLRMVSVHGEVWT